MNEPKQPKKDSNAARRKSPIRQLQSLIDSGALSPSEQLQAIKRLASLKAAKAKDRKAKAVARREEQTKPPHGKEWKPSGGAFESLYARHVREGIFTGTFAEWLAILNSCTYQQVNEGKNYIDILRKWTAEHKEQH